MSQGTSSGAGVMIVTWTNTIQWHKKGYNKYWTDLKNKTLKCVTREDIKYVFINLIQIKLVVHKLMSHVFLIKCN